VAVQVPNFGALMWVGQEWPLVARMNTLGFRVLGASVLGAAPWPTHRPREFPELKLKYDLVEESEEGEGGKNGKKSWENIGPRISATLGLLEKFLFYLLTDLNLPRPKTRFFGNNLLVMERYFVEL
jgi:hypothetical protein